MASLAEYERAEGAINLLLSRFKQNISNLDKLGEQPYKPSSEKRFFGKGGRAGASPATKKFFDDSKKIYDAWNRKKLKLDKENTTLSNQIFYLIKSFPPEVAEYYREQVFHELDKKKVADYEMRTMRKRNKTIIKAGQIEHLDVARVHNPRYLVSRDGEEVGIFPGYNALMAINAARKIYGPGKYSSTKTGEAMYLGRGALETERREREERTARAAAKAAAKRDKIQLPKKSRTRRNAGGADILQQGVKAGLLPAGLVTDLQRLEEGRFPADPARRANLLQRALKLRNDLVYQNLVEENPLGEAVQRALYDVIARQQRRLHSRRNPAEKDAEHPIEVTRHFRGGPPGYLSPWQKAMAIGQQELFDTGIKLAPRAAELRAARLSNPGATKPVYLSGVKEATAGQLPRLARVGLRVGHSPAEIRSDLAATGRFTAEQIRRAIDQATTAERRSNPTKRDRRNPPVKEIFEAFNGRPATKTTTVQAPRRTPGRVAQLGRLRLIRTADGRTWRFPGERAPFLAADSRGKLHVVGGQYRANPAGEECGEIEQIEYQTSKPHLGHDSETIYYHQLGEETGERPMLEITPEGELQIVGGDYRIEADGIHN